MFIPGLGAGGSVRGCRFEVTVFVRFVVAEILEAFWREGVGAADVSARSASHCFV